MNENELIEGLIEEHEKNPSESKNLAQLYYTEWEYRHKFYWSYLYKWYAAIVIVQVVPYIKPEIIFILGNGIFIFPIISTILTIIATWHLLAEEKRVVFTRRQLWAIRNGQNMKKEYKNRFKWIGTSLTLFGAIFFIGVSIFSFIKLFALIK